MSDVSGALSRLAASKAAKAKEPTKAKSDKPVKAKVVQLYLWPEHTRALPNGMLRSALFGVVGARTKRKTMAREKIHAIAGVDIYYTGQQLCQSDLDVFSNLLHIARLQELGDKCYFTSYQMLALLGLTDTGPNRRKLSERISRLNATALDYQGYEGSLVASAKRAEDDRMYEITFDPDVIKLFKKDAFTLIDHEVRLALYGAQLAQWLFAFYSTHAQPVAMKVSTLWELSGSKGRANATELAAALGNVATACKKNGLSYKFTLEKGLVHCTKRGSKSQINHINKRGK